MGADHVLIEVAIEPRSKEDRAVLEIALAEFGDTAKVGWAIDHESGQFLLRGSGEDEIDAWLSALIDERGVGLNVGAPQVAYRETLGCAAEVDRTYARNLGPKGDFARVILRFQPLAAGSGFRFENAAPPDAIPLEFVPAVRAGLEAACEGGLIAGFPVIDFEATLVGGAYHEVDSSPFAFEIAARQAFKELRAKAQPVLLEPVMNLEIGADEQDLGSVIGDLNSRRGHIVGQSPRNSGLNLRVQARLSNLYGYGAILRALSQGRASFAMEFSHYEPVPTFDDDPENFPPAVGMRA